MSRVKTLTVDWPPCRPRRGAGFCPGDVRETAMPTSFRWLASPLPYLGFRPFAVGAGFMVKLLGTGAAKPRAQPAVAGKPVRDGGSQMPEAGILL
jgi:hypothetical protein